MHKKMGFTLLEVLIVIMIISVLFVAFRSSFQIKNKDLAYGQTCIETLYGQVNNFLHAGISSKSISSGTDAIFPDQYIITFKPSQQLIQLSYEKQGSRYIYSSMEITGDTAISYCSSNNYMIFLSGDNYELHINKGLQENQNMQFFYITELSLTGSSAAVIRTGESVFLQCDLQGTGCKTMARFETDVRTISLKKQICLSFTGADCLERDN